MKKLFKKTYLGLGLFLFSLFCPLLTFADNTYFGIANNDTSVDLLRKIFGYFGGLFKVGIFKTAAPTGIFNSMFREFNGAMVILATIISVYMLIIIIINTAKDGTFAGQKFDSIWVPFRSVLGWTLVIPIPKAGYSAIQIMMMWVVLHGIGAADRVWNVVADYAAAGNPIVDLSKNPVGSQTPLRGDILSDSGKVFVNLVCAHQVYKDLGMADTYKLPSITTTNEYTLHLSFGPTIKGAKYDCGDVSWIKGLLYDPAYTDGFNNMASVLNQYAKDYVEKGGFTAGQSDLNPMYISSKYLQTLIEKIENKSGGEGMGDAEKDWRKAWLNAKDQGWANAGMYYFLLASTSRYDEGFNLFKIGTDKKDYYKDDVKVLGSGSSNYYLSNDYVNKVEKNVVNNWRFDALTRITSRGDEKEGQAVSWYNWDSAGIVNQLTSVLFSGIGNVLVSIFTWNIIPLDPSGGLFAGGHPLLRLMAVGHTMTSMVVFIILILGAVMAVYISLTKSIVGIIAILFGAGGIKAVASILSYGIGALLIAVYSMGLTMSVYIPLVPFIIFSFAVIGWLIAVIETILAAPIVAVALIYPESQNEMWGRADPAIQLIINVFLRPSLMVFGMIAGIIVSAVAVFFVSEFFNSLVNGLSAISGGGIVESVLYVAIYISLVIAIVNRSFSLIHVFPDRILSWIGWQSQFGEYAKDAEREVKEGFTGASQATGKAAEEVGRTLSSKKNKGGGGTPVASQPPS